MTHLIRTSPLRHGVGLGVALAALAASTAFAAPHDRVVYRAALQVDGTWSETVSAPVDEADTDGDGREEVASRSQAVRFTLTSAVPDIVFRGGRPERTTSVAHGLPVQTIDSSTLTEPNGESGSCRTHRPGTGGSAEVVSAPGGLVLRPAGDVILQAVCSTEHLEWGFALDLMRLGGPLGQAPLDATVPISASEVGARRIVRTVAASPLQTSRARCPQEDPGHTAACSFGWSGTVVLERTGAVRSTAGDAGLASDGRSASVEVVCPDACAPRLGLGRSSLVVDAPAGTSRAVLPLDATTRRVLRRTGRGVLKVRLDGRTRSFVLRARRAR